LTDSGTRISNKFEGNTPGNRGGYEVGTRGRSSTPQPGNLANGDPVFAVIAFNTLAVAQQYGIARDFPGEMAAQISGLGQRLKPISFFIHESAENREFARIGASDANYNAAHTAAQTREATIRAALGITGGFSGGAVRVTVPREQVIRPSRALGRLQ
jgi:hypothetical protein